MDNELKAKREKYWAELNDSEKIERLREVIKSQDNILIKISGYLDQLIEHEHLNGNIVKKISHPNAESYGSIYWKKPKHLSDEWF